MITYRHRSYRYSVWLHDCIRLHELMNSDQLSDKSDGGSHSAHALRIGPPAWPSCRKIRTRRWRWPRGRCFVVSAVLISVWTLSLTNQHFFYKVSSNTYSAEMDIDGFPKFSGGEGVKQKGHGRSQIGCQESIFKICCWRYTSSSQSLSEHGG